MHRRTFLAAPIFAAAAGTASEAADSLPVQASGDGIRHTPTEYAALLQKLSPTIEPDDYSRGGVVAKLEQSVAAALGKETAVWLSTGTLANHLAVRLLPNPQRPQSTPSRARPSYLHRRRPRARSQSWRFRPRIGAHRRHPN